MMVMAITTIGHNYEQPLDGYLHTSRDSGGVPGPGRDEPQIIDRAALSGPVGVRPWNIIYHEGRKHRWCPA
jgi:hypothetical protein